MTWTYLHFYVQLSLEQLWPKQRYCPGISLKELRKPPKKPQSRWSQGPPKYKVGALSNQLESSV
jgi:hypothetical protein